MSHKGFAQIGKNLLVALCSCALAFFVIDSVLRLTIRQRLYYREQEMFENRMPEYPSLLLRYDKLIDYKGSTFGDLAATSGNLQDKEPREIRFKTDSKGYRNEPDQHKKENEIIVIGDSFGAGIGTDQDSTCVGFLSRHNIVYNMSFPGNPLLELANLVLDYDQVKHTEKPLVLWLLFTGNDLPNSIPEHQYKYVDILEQNQLKDARANTVLIVLSKFKNYLRRSPVWLLLLHARSEKNANVVLKPFEGGKKMYFYQNYVYASQLSGEDIANQQGFDALKRTFLVAKKYSETKKFDLKVVLIPTKYEIYKWIYEGDTPWKERTKPSGFSLSLASIFNELEVDFFDSKDFLFDYAEMVYKNEKKLLWWRDDTHLNVEGHKALSAFLQNIIHTPPVAGADSLLQQSHP